MEKIKGYRELTSTETELINQIKTAGNEIGTLITVMEEWDAVDKRWLSIARTDLQKGFMSLVRSVAKPNSF